MRNILKKFFWPVLFLLSALALTGRAFYDLPRIPHFDKIEEINDTYSYRGRILPRMHSSECAVNTGYLLAICKKDGKVVPIEDTTVDDWGLALFADVFALMTGEPATIDYLYQQNIFVNLFGYLFTALGLYILGWKASAVALTLLMTGTSLSGPFPSADVMGVFAGTAGLGLSGLLFVLAGYRSLERKDWVKALFLLALAFLLFSLATLIREPLGVLAVLSTIVILFIRSLSPIRTGRLRSFLFFAVLSSFFTVTFKAPKYLLQLRNEVYDMKPVLKNPPSHGFSHNLYIGLGTAPNPWGIKYDDNQGRQLLEKYGSFINYGSKEYYSFMMGEYLDILKKDSSFVLGMYWRKYQRATMYQLDSWLSLNPIISLVLWFLLQMSFLALLILRRPSRIPPLEERIVPLAFLLVTWLILLQGILSIPDLVHIYPAYYYSVVVAVLSLEMAFLKGFAMAPAEAAGRSESRVLMPGLVPSASPE